MMSRICLLSSAYLAPVQYYTKLYAYAEAYVEAYEHYVKQTYRNRCLIASPSGVQAAMTVRKRAERFHRRTDDRAARSFIVLRSSLVVPGKSGMSSL